MVSVYSNRSTTGSFVGSCRNGAVYDLSNHFMGGYRDGKIYNSSGSLIGSYNDESIYSYDTSYERIGYFGESTVYDLGNQARGECISDKGAHAAALIFFAGCYSREDGTPDSSEKETVDADFGGNTEASAQSSAAGESASESGGLFWVVVTIVSGVMLALARAIWWIYYKVFSFFGPLPSIIFMTTVAPVGAAAVSLPPFAVWLSVSVFSYIPSMIVMIVFIVQKKITVNQMRTAGALWCVVGPFAWIYLVRARKKNREE